MSTEVATVEVNDAMFCGAHLKEVCTECDCDLREENDGFYGFEAADRDPIECPTSSTNKDGVYQCKKHGSASCSQCYGWKKQITRARTQAKKAGRK